MAKPHPAQLPLHGRMSQALIAAWQPHTKRWPRAREGGRTLSALEMEPDIVPATRTTPPLLPLLLLPLPLPLSLPMLPQAGRPGAPAQASLNQEGAKHKRHSGPRQRIVRSKSGPVRVDCPEAKPRTGTGQFTLEPPDQTGMGQGGQMAWRTHRQKEPQRYRPLHSSLPAA